MIKHSNSCDGYCRSLVARILGHYPYSEAKPILFKFLEDNDNLVRTEAADSTGCFSDIEIHEKLRCHTEQDKYFLVRGYSLLSMGNMSKKTF